MRNSKVVNYTHILYVISSSPYFVDEFIIILIIRSVLWQTVDGIKSPTPSVDSNVRSILILTFIK